MAPARRAAYSIRPLTRLGAPGQISEGLSMKIIDFHNHFYPPAYLDAICKGPSNCKVTIDSAGNPCLHYPGDYNIAVPGHRDIGYRTNVLKQIGIATQVLSFTTPG